ncbi:hypothetical protein GCM10022207_89560 [Streptomyces lannensis]|uniref:Uncharacterized protein n=2 Tax=Streptomyces lannensis TaxID=766498 RepID=A0ABP7LRK2_9ACTN
MPRSNDLLASAVFPRGIWRQIWSAPQERLNKEICRRTELPGISPIGPPCVVGTVLVEQDDE